MGWGVLSISFCAQQVGYQWQQQLNLNQPLCLGVCTKVANDREYLISTGWSHQPESFCLLGSCSVAVAFWWSLIYGEKIFTLHAHFRKPIHMPSPRPTWPSSSNLFPSQSPDQYGQAIHHHLRVLLYFLPQAVSLCSKENDRQMAALSAARILPRHCFTAAPGWAVNVAPAHSCLIQPRTKPGLILLCQLIIRPMWPQV